MANPLRSTGHAIKAAATRLRQMVFPSAGGRWGPFSSWSRGWTNPFTAQVGNGRGGSIVEPTLKWIGKNFSEPRARVQKPTKGGELEPVKNHPLVKLLRRPNPAYSGITLWLATVPDWKLGDAYWYKVRSAQGRVVELWWLPSCWVEPRWDPTDSTSYIDWYDYNVNGLLTRLDPRDVIHFRNGLDPHNTRKGMSDLACVLAEIANDNEASGMVSALLHNLGVPGAIISPMGDNMIDPEAAEGIKTNYQQKTTGAHRGEPLVIAGPVKVDAIAFSPEQMNLTALRRVPEERITAALGPAAIVVGLGAGLDHATYANAEALNRYATLNELVPDWRYFEEELQYQLLPEFEDPDVAEFDFDLATVRSLREDETALVDRTTKLWQSGQITLNQALRRLGEDQIGTQGDIYFVPINGTLTPLAELGVTPAPVAPVPDPNAPPPTAKGLLDWPEYRVETKAADGWVTSMERLRGSLATPAQRDVQRFLTAQTSRVVSSLTPTKAVATVDWDAEDRALTTVLNRSYLRALDGTTELARGYLQADIEVDDATVRSFLQASGQRIGDINHTTRRAIQKALAEGEANGESLEELTARIQELTEFNASRAETIALTELGSSQALAAAYASSLAGLTHMQIADADGTDVGFTGCTDRHGKVITVAQAFETTLLHPRCRLVLIPLATAPKSNGNGHGVKELVGV